MEILELDSNQYHSAFINSYHIFNTALFNELNKANAEEIFYLAFKDTKIRIGIILGVRDKKLFSSFSAPFGGFQYVNEDIKITQIDTALIALENWIKGNHYENIKITLPPVFYNQSFINKQANALFRCNYELNTFDLNYQFAVSKLEDNYLTDVIWYNARKNLKKSLKNNLSFVKLNSDDGEQSYKVISQNRSEKGFPLRMTWDQIKKTMDVVKVDFFLVKLEQVNIAAALIFHVAKDIVQVVYWGDLIEYSDLKTMNFLSYNVFKYYKQNNISIIDIGPSTENSLPNFGLCEFKESIGCDISNKSVFTKCF